ncbi:MAG: Rrf2 family transcriptional regulator [Bacteroidetes bacterium]|nr:Rrf2 family transcriptional regulator [Bacteroidota bacterium]
MLKISKSVEYSIFALKQIYNNQNSNLLIARDIAQSENIPAELVAKLLQKMKKNGILESVQGKLGGYRFAINAEDITLFSVVEAIDEDIQVTECLCENATEEHCKRILSCSLRSPFNKLQNEIINLMKNLKLTEMFN